MVFDIEQAKELVLDIEKNCYCSRYEGGNCRLSISLTYDGFISVHHVLIDVQSERDRRNGTVDVNGYPKIPKYYTTFNDRFYHDNLAAICQAINSVNLQHHQYMNWEREQHELLSR